ncbi:putative TonB-dependent receptor [Aliivibrio wodanis]|uniref:Putative TonB-dependent receptor n=1 Tax=Aliivibrio wodanis TaxID=80852 RepID=A0A090ISS7_9GAMM|nr:putative TonB-dependent receptor [Aliivibrio wodanis]
MPLMRISPLNTASPSLRNNSVLALYKLRFGCLNLILRLITELLRTIGGFMATARLDIRLDAEIKAKAEKASALLGLKSLTEYVVRLMDEDSTQVISEHESITVEANVFDQFMAACDEAKAPNNALLEAAAFTKSDEFK